MVSRLRTNGHRPASNRQAALGACPTRRLPGLCLAAGEPVAAGPHAVAPAGARPQLLAHRKGSQVCRADRRRRLFPGAAALARPGPAFHIHPQLGHRQPHAARAFGRQRRPARSAGGFSQRAGGPAKDAACVRAELGFHHALPDGSGVAAGREAGMAHAPAPGLQAGQLPSRGRVASPESGADRRCRRLRRRPGSDALALGHAAARRRRSASPGRGWQALPAVSRRADGVRRPRSRRHGRAGARSLVQGDRTAHTVWPAFTDARPGA